MSQKVYVPLTMMHLSLLILKHFQKQCPFYLHMGKQISPNTQISEALFVYRPSAFVAPSCSVDNQEWSGPTEEGGTSQPTPLPDTRLDAPRFHFSLHDQSHLELQDGETTPKKKERKKNKPGYL